MPTGQADASAQVPEQAAEARPADAPHVPAGQSEHAAAPASAKVPGGQGVQLMPMGMDPPAQDGAIAAVLPAVQAMHSPEHAAVVRPALAP